LSVTWVLSGKVALQPFVAPLVQLIPAGVLVTVPVPFPARATVTPSPAMKDAVTLVAAFKVTEQLVPEQAPPHPLNRKLLAGVAVRVTFVPEAKLAVQVPGQLIPDGLLVIVPCPAAGAVTVS
jgi:hypothetical protein